MTRTTKACMTTGTDDNGDLFGDVRSCLIQNTVMMCEQHMEYILV